MTEQQAIRWYPMRVTYNRELKVKEELDKLSIENFIPMHYEIVETRENRREQLVPAIHNLVFVHSTRNELTTLKRTRREFEAMRYMRRKRMGDENYEILHVPDRQMENFLKVASVQDDSVRFLKYDDLIGKRGKKVRVIEGPFAGVEGVVERIKKNKRVVVRLEGVAAVAITFVPPSFLTEVE